MCEWTKSSNFLPSSVRAERISLSALSSSVSLEGRDTFICTGKKCLFIFEDENNSYQLAQGRLKTTAWKWQGSVKEIRLKNY